MAGVAGLSCTRGTDCHLSANRRLSPKRRLHLKGRDQRGDRTPLLGRAEEGAIGGALRLDDVIGVVSEGLAGVQAGELAHDAIALNHQGVAIRVFHDPLPAEDIDGLGRVIVNGDLIDEGMGSIRGGRACLIILHAVNRDGESFEGFKLGSHNGTDIALEAGSLKSYADSCLRNEWLRSGESCKCLSMTVSPPPVLSIAGSDCSAGAGIQADLKTMSALGCYGLTALTSVVSETPGRVSLVRLLEPEFIADQVRVLFEGFPIAGAKMGMLGGAEQVAAVVEAWQRYAGAVPLVVDPVMVATGGGRLLNEDAVKGMREQVLPLARVITPNMDEAEVLWGRSVTTREGMAACAADLAAVFGTAVLVKGGHLIHDRAADVLCDQDGVEWYETERVDGVHTHGTGCSYSAAIACGLAKGLALRAAVAEAKAFIARAIRQHFEWKSAACGSIHALNHLSQS